MTYQLYRNTTLGNSLQESLDEGSLNTNRFCNNVWTFVLNDVEFREVTELIKVDKVGIPGINKNLKTNNTKQKRYTSGLKYVERFQH
uniref:Transcription initiation factor IIA gamma chain n=1 Tax=Canis lupus familiaris TaxID=9615 RepID=A0A8I3S9Z7_CANLF